MAYVQVPILSTLPGHVGSNPHIVNPEQTDIPTEDAALLKKIFPDGAQPGNFFDIQYQKLKILTYIFEFPQEDARNDLASLSFVTEKKTNVKNLKLVIHEIFQRLEKHNLLTLETIHQNLNNLTESLNKESKFKIGTFVFDIKYFLKSNKVKLDENRRVRGSMI